MIKNLDEEEKEDVDENKATGFSIFLAAIRKEIQNRLVIINQRWLYNLTAELVIIDCVLHFTSFQ